MNKKRINRQKGKYIIKAVCITLTLALCLTAPAFGETGTVTGPDLISASGDRMSQETGILRSAEEWSALLDNRLEWKEIPGLVEEYSPAVLEERRVYRKNENREKDAAQTSKALANTAEQYENLAAACDGMEGGQLQAVQYRMQAENLREQAADNTGDGRVLELGMQQAVVREKKNVRDLFVAWHEAGAALEENRTQITALEKEVQYARTRYTAGLTTKTAVTDAETSLAAARNSTVTLENAYKSAYRSLIVSCGWKYDASAEIGELPAPESLFLTEEELMQGETKALENSFLLREDRIRLENANHLYGEGVVKEKAAARLASDTESVRDGYLQARENLKIAEDRYKNACADLVLAEKSLSTKKKQLDAGKISEQTYRRQQSELSSAQASVRSMLHTLIRTRNTYDAVAEGLAL